MHCAVKSMRARSFCQNLIFASAEKQPPDHFQPPPAFAPSSQRVVPAQPKTGLTHATPAPLTTQQPHRKDNTRNMATLAPAPAPAALRHPGTKSPPPFTPQPFFPGQLPQGLFSPSSRELAEAITMLDMNRDGKIWGSDLDMLLEIAFGVDARGASESEGGTRSSWQEFKSLCEGFDGLLSLNSVLRAVELGRIQSEVAKMRPEAWEREFRRTRMYPSQLFPSLRKFVEGFNNFDKDGNGVICAKDLKESLKFFCGVEFSVAECRDIIRKVDSVYDGVIELNDFGPLMEYLMKH